VCSVIENVHILWCLTPPQIDFKKQQIGDVGSNCLLSVDGTHCPIEARGKLWYSHKFKKPGVAYELGLCIKTGHIVWLCWITSCLKMEQYFDFPTCFEAQA
jgi:hypothetical protein